MKKVIIILIVLLHGYTGFSQTYNSITIKRIVDETMANGTAYENLRILCEQVGISINLNGYPHTGVTVYNDSFPKFQRWQ